jgi:transposase-like protein
VTSTGIAGEVDFFSEWDRDVAALVREAPGQAEFPEADTICLFDQTVTRIWEDGSRTEIVHQAFKILTQGGVQRYGQVTIPGEVFRIRTFTPDGRILEPIQAAGGRTFQMPGVEPGAVVVTDGWAGYVGLERHGYIHDRRSQRAARTAGEDPAELLPAVHRVASLAKRWLLGTHQGSVDDAHLPSYLNEFTFRFNRRTSRSRGLVFYRLLELAAAHQPVRYRELIVNRQPGRRRPAPPRTRGRPPSLERPRARRPWRQT